MDAEKIFVGRKAELEQFKEVLENPKGQAVLVVGHRGMGKTWLINKMASIAENHPELKCGWVRYEVRDTDSVDSRLEIMMDDAYEAAANPGKFLGTDDRGKKQWLSMYEAFEEIPVAGNVLMAVRKLAGVFQRETTKDTRKQFIEKLRIISEKMPENGRAVFIIDPEKYMQEKSDSAWAGVVSELPNKIKIVFAQRPEDVLVESETFDRLDNVATIPEKRLDVLSEEDVDELVNCRKANLRVEIQKLRKVLERYKGHPYAVGAALDLVEQGTKLEELPEKPEPTKFAEVQWKELSKKSKDAICLFKGYTILEVGVPDDVVESVSEIDSDTRQHLLADKFLRGLLREEGEGKRIYHAILADYILGQIGEAEKKEYHARAVEIYRERLHKEIEPDGLAAMRLAEHVLAAEGKEAFVYAFANECYPALNTLGLLDTAESLSHRGLEMVGAGSEEKAVLLGNLGLIYQKRGELDKAEEMHKRALDIDKKLGLQEGMASDYGNLGLIYQIQGDLDKAEEMYLKSLEISERQGMLELTANQYGNLGLIYRKQGDLDKAEEMHRKALEIDEKLGLQEGIAIDYGNLGLIYQTRGELDKAEEMYLKSLEISEPRGMLEPTANQYGNLGLIYKQRGNLKKAEEYWQKALELFKKIGMQPEVEKVEGWIDKAS